MVKSANCYGSRDEQRMGLQVLSGPAEELRWLFPLVQEASRILTCCGPAILIVPVF